MTSWSAIFDFCTLRFLRAIRGGQFETSEIVVRSKKTQSPGTANCERCANFKLRTRSFPAEQHRFRAFEILLSIHADRIPRRVGNINVDTGFEEPQLFEL